MAKENIYSLRVHVSVNKHHQYFKLIDNFSREETKATLKDVVYAMSVYVMCTEVESYIIIFTVLFKSAQLLWLWYY